MSHTIVLASSNSGKLEEISAILADHPVKLVTQAEYAVNDAPETGLTFVENALIKARHACSQTGLMAMADDSGLEVDALNGAPGIFSARYAGEHGDHTANNSKLLDALKQVPNNQRQARFRCVIVLLRHTHDPTPLICQGTWEGHIADHLAGTQGFGYDPLFVVATHGCSAAQLSATTKNQISHRAQALQQLTTQLRQFL